MSSARPVVITDEAVRLEALDPARSWLLQAPAGSGKTELLMQRFLACLATVEQPESVLAITFTRKAAAEMRNRILAALDEARTITDAALDDCPAHKQQTLRKARAALAHGEALGWKLPDQPARLQVRTLDAFCESVAQRAPFKGQLGGATDVTEDAGRLYRAAAQRVIDRLGAVGTQAEAVATLLETLDNDVPRARTLLATMLAQRDQWLQFLGRSDAFDPAQQQVFRDRLEAALREAVEEELARIRATLAAQLDIAQARELFVLLRHATRDDASRIAAIAAAAEPVPISTSSWAAATAAQLPQWRAIADLLLTKAGTLRSPKGLNKNNGFPVDTPEAKAMKLRCAEFLTALQPRADVLCAALVVLRALPDPHYTDAQWRLMRAVLELLPLAAAHLKLVFAEEATIDFAEYSMRALDAIGDEGDPTELGLQLGYRIRHVLLDEFQDTSHLQMELLRRLLGTWDPGEGCSIFCVGDPMQSIYAFRQADVAIFQQARREGIAAQSMEFRRLSRNFRSQQRLVDWFNRIFPSILCEDSELVNAVPYAPAEATCPALVGDAVAIKAFAAGDRAAEAAHLAASIQRELAQPTPAGDSPTSIAVLVRARTHLPEMVEALRRAGIRYRALKTDRLSDRPLVRDLEALRKALTNPADRTAWLAVLRAPWCGLQLADLLALCAGDDRSTIRELLQQRCDQLSAVAQSAIARCLPVLEAALARHGRTPLRTLVESTWLRLAGPACLADAEREQGIRDSEAYFALLEAESTAASLRDPEAFPAKLHDLFAPPDASPDIRVEIMPIHQAKGLEWDIVFLPALERKTHGDDKQLLYWRSRRVAGRELLLLGPMESTIGAPAAEASIESYLRGISSQCAEEELKRLFYVAATRARRRLYLSAAVTEEKQPASGSILRLLWNVPELQQAFAAPPAPDADAAAPAPQRPELLLRRLPAPYIAPAAPEALPWNAPPPAATGLQHSFQWAGELARLIGVVTHGFLERIASEGSERWDEARINASRPAIAAWLLRGGATRAELDEGCTRVLRALRQTVADPRGLWLLSSHPEHACELALSAVVEGRLEHIRVDRTFIENGTRWLIDYKTSPQEGGDLSRWVEMQVDKYRPDMQRYTRVVRAWDPRPIRCALYLPLLTVFREVEISSSARAEG